MWKLINSLSKTHHIVTEPLVSLIDNQLHYCGSKLYTYGVEGEREQFT